jgi:hypothetical protein
VPVPPGVEPLFAGSRITDLLAADLTDVRGIAVTAGALPGEEPRFLFSYQAVYTTDRRSEGLLRIALTGDGVPAPVPADAAPPLRSAGDPGPGVQPISALLNAANQEARAVAMTGSSASSTRPGSPLQTVRRLAIVYSNAASMPRATRTRPSSAGWSRRGGPPPPQRDAHLIGVTVLAVSPEAGW